ncbi:hypothetical protein RSAG8_01957, partial [Rhizoctonia solani AG-8 WAC10335]
MFSLTGIWESLIFALCFVYRRIYPPASTSRIASIPTPSPNSDSKRPIPLPQETLEHIFSLHIAALVDSLRCETVRDYRVRKRCLVQEISAVAQSSKQFHTIMLRSLGRMWACGPGLCSQKKCPNTTGLPARTIWIITAEQGCLPLDTNLAVHKMLEIASINYHDGIQWSKGQQEFRRFRCIRAYPRSLRHTSRHTSFFASLLNS